MGNENEEQLNQEKEQQIMRLMPLLRNTNPSMNEAQLRELAIKILSPVAKKQEFENEDRPISELIKDEEKSEEQ